MAVIDFHLYTDIANSLEKSNNDRNHRYMTGYQVGGSSPLDPIIPLFEKFYGPRVLSIVVVSKNYWHPAGVFQYPEDLINDQKERIKTGYLNWVEYKVVFYTDFVLANHIMEATPTSAYREQMETVKGKLIEICAAMGDYGFEYKEDIEEGKDETFFQPLIDEFWGKKKEGL